MFCVFICLPKGVAQLYPASGTNLCGHANGDTSDQNTTVTVACRNGTIQTIDFASFGNPRGICGNYTKGMSLNCFALRFCFECVPVCFMFVLVY